MRGGGQGRPCGHSKADTLGGREAIGGIGAEVTWPDSGCCAGSHRRKRVEAAKWVRLWNPNKRRDPVRVKVAWFWMCCERSAVGCGAEEEKVRWLSGVTGALGRRERTLLGRGNWTSRGQAWRVPMRIGLQTC